MLARIKSISAILVFVIALVVSQAALADRSPGKTLVGAWVVEIVPVGLEPAVDITVIHKDGTVSNSDSKLGTGHGIWKRLGAKQESEEEGGKVISPSTFQVRFKTPILEGNSLGIPGGFILTVTATVTLDQSGNAATGPFVTTIGPPGFPGPGFVGEVRFARISLDD